MRFHAQEVSCFHCPRWAELPSLPLYMDQVLLVLEEALPLFVEDQERAITPAMINNYVKQKLILPPVKKKYGKQQLSQLVFVTVLKRVFSMQEIMVVMQVMADTFGIDAAYDCFCEQLEQALKNAFADGAAASPHEQEVPPILHATLVALMGKLQVQQYVADHAPATPPKEKPPKEKLPKEKSPKEKPPKEKAKT